MQNRIFIEEDKEFTLDEFAHLVARAIRSIASSPIDSDEVLYSRDDVYFTIIDVIGFINERTPGSFKLTQTSFEKYHIHYIPPHAEEKKAKRNLIVSKARTAVTIKETAGRYPVWAERDDEIMSIIHDIENRPKAAPTHIPKTAAQAQSEMESEIERLAKEAIRVFKANGNILSSVTSNIAVMRRFHEILKKEREDDE